jgi:hypothetical protein
MASYYKPNTAYYGILTITDATGAAVNADSLPTATANKNGTDDGAFTLTCANLDTGRYKITGTVPSGYVAGDRVNITASAVISSISTKKPVDQFVVETATNSEIFTGLGSVKLSVGVGTGQANLSGGSIPIISNADITSILAVVNGLQVLPKSVACANFPVKMVLTSDHNSPATGKTVSGFISKDGGAFAALTTATCTEIGLGAYKVNITQTEMNADFILLAFTASACDQRMFAIKTQA